MGASTEAEGRTVLKGVVVTEAGQVKVWSTIGVKMPVGDLDYTMIEFSFGHERFAKNGTQEEIRKTSVLVDEFNQAELERRLAQAVRLIRRTMEPEKKGKKKAKGSVMDRARGRV